MALSKKDQRTLTITITLLLGFVVWSFGVDPLLENYNQLNERLESEQKKYAENQQTLAEGADIDEGYKRVEAQFEGYRDENAEPEDLEEEDGYELDPREQFNEEVVDLVANVIGEIPQYSPPSTAQIQGASGYEFLILPLTVRADLPKVSELLKEFDKRGYLIQTARINRDPDLDKEELTLELNLGRIVKIVEEEELDSPMRPGARRLSRGGAR